MGSHERTIGLVGATSIGVGAIVGGGFLALAGTAFAATGSGAMLAFSLNGVIAMITALSFAELSSAFPQSGGTYVFAKRVLSVGSAFGVGWLVWFASIVAAALYAIGFTSFFVNGIQALVSDAGFDALPSWMVGSTASAVVALCSTVGAYAWIARSTSFGGALLNAIKVLVLVALVLGGLIVWLGDPTPVGQRLSPFLPHGIGGLVQAMGFTFIALQGFDLIAAVAGEVKDPRHTLPRAMILSLCIALAVYVPLLVVVPLVGVPETDSLLGMAARNPDTVLAEGARNFLGLPGYWLVMLAGLLGMFMALMANLYAASRIAWSMARDRTLPASLETVHVRRGTPTRALAVTAAVAAVILLFTGDVSSAGATSSLIFLLTFALANVLCVVTRRRTPQHGGFRTPFWPWLPAFGALSCGALAVFQAFAVPSAGVVAGCWLLAGGLAYAHIFGSRARVQDAAQEAADPDLLALRGRSPLVLVPVANPDNAAVMALMAWCLSPPRVGRVLLLNVIDTTLLKDSAARRIRLDQAAKVLRDSLDHALEVGVRAEALATCAADPWEEIETAARRHRCASMLLGMSSLADAELRGRLEGLASRMDCNVVLFRGPRGWQPQQVRRVLVPIGGRVSHNALRARLLHGLRHRAAPDFEVEYLLVLPKGTSEFDRFRARENLVKLLRDEFEDAAELHAVVAEDVVGTIVEHAQDCDLLVLGIGKVGRHKRVFSETTRLVVAKTECAVVVISQRE